MAESTQVAIIGAGPAGLFLGHILRQAGIDSVILEAHSREHIEARVRAGVLETGTISAMAALGLDARLRSEGLVDTGLDMRFRGQTIHLDLPGLTGREVMIYGQQEVVKDLVAARLAAGDPLHFDAEALSIADVDRDRPRVRFRHDDTEHTLECDLVAACDGFHGIGRASIPPGVLTTYEQVYDFAWFGVLSRSRPLADMTYSNSDRGFALCSRRSPEVSRLYLQVPTTVDLDEWSDDRFWDELHQRMFDEDRTEIEEGEIFQRDLARLRAFVALPMQFGRLFLAGDAAHIAPPAGAKGLNMAVADACTLAKGMIRLLKHGDRDVLDRYTDSCADRVWRTIGFSTRLTSLLHPTDEQTPFQRHLQLSELEMIAGSRAAQQVLAEQYVSLNDVSHVIEEVLA